MKEKKIWDWFNKVIKMNYSMEKILDEAEKRVELMASEYAYRQTEGISDKNVQSVTFLMIRDNILRGSRMMREVINDLNKKNHEQETVREGYEY